MVALPNSLFVGVLPITLLLLLLIILQLVLKILERIETYIDVERNRHRAMSYGHDSSNLVVWYNIIDIQKCFPIWKIPDSTEFENTNIFRYNKKIPDQNNS